MAFLTFSPWPMEDGPAMTRGAVRPVAQDVTRFTPMELRVIGMAARNDAERGFAHGSRFGRLLEWAFGVKLNRPLANPRLEALRRFASLARHHPRQVSEDVVSRFVDQGYSFAQAQGLLAYFSDRSDRPAGIA